MAHFDYQRELGRLWHKALDLYRTGQRNPASLFTQPEQRFLASIGVAPQEVFDYVEDFASDDSPDFATFILVHDLRRAYFLEIQNGVPSPHTIPTDDLPPKQAALRGIEWLPRLIAKARGKLRGELSDDIMFGCGGDRHFFRTRNVHPAEFLRLVWRTDSDETIAAWVQERGLSNH